MVTEKFRSPHERESKIVLNSEFQGRFRIHKKVLDSGFQSLTGLRFTVLRLLNFLFQSPGFQIP